MEHQRRRIPLPAGSTDCHSHVVGPVDRWPMIADRRYEPEQGPVADYIATLARLGLDRCVLVQPSIYGTDNGCQIEAMQEIGASAAAVSRWSARMCRKLN